MGISVNINGISKSYGKNRALSDFTATLEPGIHALLGPNGSGKSTLMNILTDNLPADAGAVTYTDADGNETDIFKMGVSFRSKLGFMPQYPELYPNFTVEEFLYYMASLKEIPRTDAKRQIPQILSSVGLDDIPRRKIGALSGGMKQRLALAQAVLGDPEVLILDEPTAGLDPKQRISIRNFISRAALSKIVLIATHVVSDIEFIARDVIILKKGVIVDFAPPHELTRKMEGHVFSVACTEDTVAEMQEKYRVINIARDEATGEIRLRIVADDPPRDDAVVLTPSLEDYYLYIFEDGTGGS